MENNANILCDELNRELSSEEWHQIYRECFGIFSKDRKPGGGIYPKFVMSCEEYCRMIEENKSNRYIPKKINQRHENAGKIQRNLNKRLAKKYKCGKCGKMKALEQFSPMQRKYFKACNECINKGIKEQKKSDKIYQCKKCKENKSLEDFTPAHRKYFTECKACTNKRIREYRLKNKS